MNVHLYFTFSLDPGNSNIKSCVTPAALILFGLFLFLHKCFTSLLLWYLSSSRKSTSLFFVLNDIIGVDLGYKWKEHVPINVRVLLNCPYQSQMIYFNNSSFSLHFAVYQWPKAVKLLIISLENLKLIIKLHNSTNTRGVVMLKK